jgi:hypothetical protein
MQTPNDLSRSLTVLKQDSALIAVIEMGLSSWLPARAWRRAPAVEKARGRRERITQGSKLLA